MHKIISSHSLFGIYIFSLHIICNCSITISIDFVRIWLWASKQLRPCEKRRFFYILVSYSSSFLPYLFNLPMNSFAFISFFYQIIFHLLLNFSFSSLPDFYITSVYIILICMLRFLSLYKYANLCTVSHEHIYIYIYIYIQIYVQSHMNIYL